MVNVAGDIKCWSGETYRFQAKVLGFHKDLKSVYVQQDNKRGPFSLPLRMFTKSSVGILKSITVFGEVVSLRIATGIARKERLKILINNKHTKESVIMNGDYDYNIEQPEPDKKDANKLAYSEVLEKCHQLGKLYNELKNGDYVIFSMSGRKLNMRPKGGHEASEFARKTQDEPTDLT